MPTIRTNKVTVECSAIKAVTYIKGSLVVSSGQPKRESVKVSHSGNTWTLEAKCGRHGTSGVASGFTRAAGGARHLFAHNVADSHPGNLNFYFGVLVDISVGGEVYRLPMYLGQGHSWGRNNWWIGCEALAHIPGTTRLFVFSPVSNALLQTFTVSGGISNFELTSWGERTFAPKELGPWLSGQGDNTLIGDLSLPGTHDSAAFNSWFATAYSTQYMNLTKQMAYGVRLFDIRLSVHEGSPGKFRFMTCHGDISLWINLHEYQSLPSALDEFRDYLQVNPKEFLAVSLKVDTWNNVPASRHGAAYNALAGVLGGYPKYTSSSMPTLGQVRGKMYLINRENSDLRLGVPVKIPNNTQGGYAPGDRNRSFRVYTQDWWEIPESPNMEARKYDFWKNAIRRAASGQMLLNFASATTPGKHTGYPYGVYINDLVLSWFGEENGPHRPGRLGWSFFDFAEWSFKTDAYGHLNVIQLIVDSNTGYRSYPGVFRVSSVTGDRDL